MPTRTIYLSDVDMAVWDEAQALAKRYRVSLSSLAIGALKDLVHERRGDVGVPLGVPVPASMKDPAVLRREQAVDRIRLVALEELEKLAAES
jgi:hypothetical protein